MNQEKIGKLIANARKRKNYTQVELAEKIGVTDKTIGNWEHARSMPDMSLWKDLCTILEIDTYELIFGEKKGKKSKVKSLEKMGRTIQERRIEQNLSQHNLASKVGVTRIAILKIEKGMFYPMLETLVKISNELNVSLEDIVYDSH